MADIFLDPRLPDPVVEQDWARVATDDAARDAVLDGFFGERISLVHGLDTAALDFAFLETVRFPQTWAMKKFQFEPLIDQVRAGTASDLVASVRRDVFDGDDARLHRFVDQMAIARDIAAAVVARLFAGRDVGRATMVARFSETRMENLHYDQDVGSDDHEAFRFYINLDAYPRIWSTSYTLTDLLAGGGRRLLDGIDLALPAETVLKRVISRAFGGWNQRATERVAPRHMIYFDPGDVWIVDGRSVSHQVTAGNRVLSVYVRIPHAGNPDLGPTFVDKLRRGIAAGLAVPPGEDTAILNHYHPKILGKSALKEDWASVFGNTRSGRLRRFDDTGMLGSDESVSRP